MKIVCIDNINDFESELPLTINKIYDAIYEKSIWYHLIDDRNIYIWYNKKYFKTLYEVRNEKINKLLDL